MATTVAAYGKVKAKAQRGEAMPEGWMIDRQGQPLTDPKRADEGFLLPIGGYKGYGLALAWEADGDLEMAMGAMRSYLHLARSESDDHLRRARAALWEWEARLQAARAAAPASAAGR